MAIDFRLLTSSPYDAISQTITGATERLARKREADANRATQAQLANDQTILQMRQQEAQASRFREEMDFRQVQEQRIQEQTAIANARAEQELNIRAATASETIKTAQQDRAIKQRQMQVMEQERAAAAIQQQRMQEAAKGGLPGIEQYLLGQGDVKTVLEMRKMQAQIQNEFLQGKKTAFELGNAAEQRDLAVKSDVVAQNIVSIMDIQDPRMRNEKLKALASTVGLEGYSAEALAIVLPQMALSHNTTLANIMKDPNLRETYRGTLEAIGTNQETLDSLFRTPDTGALKTLKEARRLRAAGDEEGASLLEASIKPSQTNISLGLKQDEEGNIRLAPGTKTQADIEKGLRTAQQLGSDLGSIQKSLKPQLLTAYSKLKGSIAETKDKFGISSKKDRELIKQREELFTPVEQVFNQYRKEITGAAASNQELDRLRQAYINRDLSPTQFEARLDTLMTKMNNDITRYASELQQGLSVPVNTKPTLTRADYVKAAEAALASGTPEGQKEAKMLLDHIDKMK